MLLRASAVALIFHRRDAGQFRLPHSVNLQQLPADLAPQPLRSFLFVVLDFHFEEEMSSMHKSARLSLYTKGMTCAKCHVRKPRRYCPGVKGDICSICCGTEREVTVDCPLDCPYLQEARKHEHSAELPRDLPNKDIRFTEEFLEERQPLVIAASRGLTAAALDTPGAVDQDLSDALDSLIRTLRTRESGVYYESRPANPAANRIYGLLQTGIEEYRKQERERLGMTHTRDSDVLAVLVFLERLELTRVNGRPRGRAFLDYLRNSLGAEQHLPRASSLIVPG